MPASPGVAKLIAPVFCVTLLARLKRTPLLRACDHVWRCSGMEHHLAVRMMFKSSVDAEWPNSSSDGGSRAGIPVDRIAR
jgi:hypothetical protein